MLKLEYVPKGLAEITSYYGIPSEEGFRAAHMVRLELPFALTASWDEEKQIKSLLLHKKVVVVMEDALKEILELVGEEKLQELKWNYLGDALAFRKKKDGRELSTHAWGIALDLNPILGPFAKPCKSYPMVIVNAFERRGFVWGGRWARQDGMHFQAASRY